MIKYFSCEIYSLNKRKISELCDGLTKNSKANYFLKQATPFKGRVSSTSYEVRSCGMGLVLKFLTHIYDII